MAVKINCTINGNNFFRVTCNVGKDSNGKYIRKQFYGKSEKDARKKMNSYLDSIKQGLNIDFNKMTLAPTMKAWLYDVVRVSNNIKPNTFDRYEGIYRNYIKESNIASLKLSSIKSIQIQKYYNELKENGKTSSQISTVNKVLKRFFFYALDECYVLKNPCIRLVIPGDVKYEDKEVEIFNDDDIIKLITAKEKGIIKKASLVCLATGIRRGEALGLREEDIDEENNEIHIKRSVGTVTIINKDGERRIKTIPQVPKTKGSVRNIPLTKELIDIFKELKIYNKLNKLKHGKEYNDDYEGFLFRSETGNLIETGNFNRAWKRFLKRNEIEYKKFHSLRHTYATKQFEADVQMKTVSHLLGHSNLATTSDIYTHVLKKQKEKSINILSVLNMC